MIDDVRVGTILNFKVKSWAKNKKKFFEKCASKEIDIFRRFSPIIFPRNIL